MNAASRSYGATATAVRASGSSDFRPIAFATRKKFHGRKRADPLISRAQAGLDIVRHRTAGTANHGRGVIGQKSHVSPVMLIWDRPLRAASATWSFGAVEWIFYG